ncbi:hypothetical protein DFH09DRAFT_1205324 [Mycena vulgaris]|nr:hypothetical protein DFH09DRAFT_1205324 [Mycena vulgaris]
MLSDLQGRKLIYLVSCVLPGLASSLSSITTKDTLMKSLLCASRSLLHAAVHTYAAAAHTRRGAVPPARAQACLGLRMLLGKRCDPAPRRSHRFRHSPPARHALLPSSIFINGVSDRDEDPTFGGGFGDVYRASYQGKMVAPPRAPHRHSPNRSSASRSRASGAAAHVHAAIGAGQYWL